MFFNEHAELSTYHTYLYAIPSCKKALGETFHDPEPKCVICCLPASFQGSNDDDIRNKNKKEEMSVCLTGANKNSMSEPAQCAE